MTLDELFQEFEAGFRRRKYTAGLLVSFIDFVVALDVPGSGITSFAELVARFPQVTTTNRGDSANTLIVERPGGGTLSLRGFYDAIETYYRAEEKRFDYPSAAPFATGRWADFIPWLEALLTATAEELAELRSRVNQFVLDALKSQAFDPNSVEVEPPLFRLLLEQFDLTAVSRREPTGASFQGIVFGFLRADNPHLQIEIDKVRTGSRRLQRIGDVDGWEGGRLAISAEVKQYQITLAGVQQLEAFANATGVRGALGVVAALGFDDDARQAVSDMGLIPLDRATMLQIVELWDPIKQRTAVTSFIYYASHVEKNSSLSDRLAAFLDQAGAEWQAARAAAITPTPDQVEPDAIAMLDTLRNQAPE